MCCTERERRPGRHAGCRIAAGLGFGHQAPDSKPRAPSSSQRAISAPQGGHLPAHPFGPAWALRAGSWRFAIKVPISSCFIWAALDSGCLKASTMGSAAGLQECSPALTFMGRLLFLPLVSPVIGHEGRRVQSCIQAQLGFAGVLVVLGFPNQFLGYECRGLGLQERCSLRSGKMPAS